VVLVAAGCARIAPDPGGEEVEVVEPVAAGFGANHHFARAGRCKAFPSRSSALP
jgi:hypothetical protein